MVTPFIRGAARLGRRIVRGPNVPRLFDERGGFLPQNLPREIRPSLPFAGPAPGPAGVVESSLPGIRRARPSLDPQDVRFVNPRLAPPPPALPLSRQTIPYAIEPPARPYVASGFETRISPSRVEGFDVPEYTPLQPAQIMQVNEAAAADPIGTVAQSIEILDSAADAQQFGRSLEIASIARSRLGTSDEAFLFNQMLDDAVRRNARRFGIDENDIDPILYTNSRQLPDERAAESFGSRGERQDWAAARTDSEKFETDTRKVIKETRRVDDLDDLDTRNNGAIYRALAAGEINAEQAKRLIDQVNYRRVRLLQDKGTLPKNIKNNTKDKEGVRGIGLLVPSVLRGSDAQKAAIYKAAIQTSESSEELAQVYSIARADVTSPEYLDVIEDALNAKTSILGQIEGVSAPRLPSVGRSTIDEGAIISSNQSQQALDEARFEAGRPENQGPVKRYMVRNPETKKMEEVVEGGGSQRIIDQSIFETPEPRPGITPTDIRIAPHGSGYVERTVYNAQNSDATIAVAMDFEAPGELLTAAAARGRVGVQIDSRGKARPFYPLEGQPNPGKSTPLFQILHGEAGYRSQVDDIVSELNRLQSIKNEPLTINFAGNSLLNLGDGTVGGISRAQSEANAFARRIVDEIMDHPERAFDIKLARSGGQHGYDTAFIKAASENGIPTGVRHPSGQYGGVMVANPLDEKAMPIFMKPGEYIAFTKGNMKPLLSKVTSSTQA